MFMASRKHLDCVRSRFSLYLQSALLAFACALGPTGVAFADSALAIRNDSASALQHLYACLLYTSPSPRDVEESRMPSSA